MTSFEATARPGARALVAMLVPALSLLAVWFVSPFAFFNSLIDLAAVLVLVVPALLLGRAVLQLFRFSDLPARWTLVLSAALGLGALSILVLVLGLAGLLHRGLWFALLAVVSLIGLYVWRNDSIQRRVPVQQAENSQSAWTFMWFLAAPFFTLALLAASNAPGLIWQEEGFGYDILEYHLQLPKEYFENGAITYFSHNVYCNFPANVEMLYLLSMIVHNDVRDIGTTANMIHLTFAALSVLTAWAIGCDISPRAGIGGGLVVATCAWLDYLSGLAYVENGMVFFGMAALGAALRGVNRDAVPLEQRKWAILAGMLAGLAAGCKYPAIPMIAIPLAIVWLISELPWKRKRSAIALYAISAVLIVSPWLFKNLAFTGNPVFPLANSLFNATPAGWSEAQTQQWDRAHAPDSAARTGMTLPRAFWSHIAGDHEQRFGPSILALGLLGLAGRRRDRIDAGLIAIVLVQLAVWLFATHQYARFALPLIISLTALAARSLPAASTSVRASLIAALLIGAAAWNCVFAVLRHKREGAQGAPSSILYQGELPGFEYLGFINKELPVDSHVLLVGDARPFYLHPKTDYFVAFNRNPFFEQIEKDQGAPATIDWLKKRRYTHIFVNWSEIRRLERSYGFSPPMTEARLSDAMDKLAQHGLTLVRTFPYPATAATRYMELFQVPSGEPK